MTEDTTIHFGATGEQYVQFDLNLSELEEPHNQLLLNLEVQVKLFTFSGSASGLIHIDELTSFYQALTKLYDTLSGEASLTTFSNWIEIKVQMQKLGHIRISGFISQSVIEPEKAVLHFRLEGIDQTYLNQTLGQFKDVLSSLKLQN